LFNEAIWELLSFTILLYYIVVPAKALAKSIEIIKAVVAREGGGVRMQFVPSEPVNDKVLTVLPGVTSVEHRGSRVIVAGSGDLTTRVLYALLKMGVNASDVQVKSGNLEDAFVKLTQTDENTRKQEVDSK
jgi:hypothetical protein